MRCQLAKQRLAFRREHRLVRARAESDLLRAGFPSRAGKFQSVQAKAQLRRRRGAQRYPLRIWHQRQHMLDAGGEAFARGSLIHGAHQLSGDVAAVRAIHQLERLLALIQFIQFELGGGLVETSYALAQHRRCSLRNNQLQPFNHDPDFALAKVM